MLDTTTAPLSVPRRRAVLAVLTAATFATVTAELLPAGVLPRMSAGLGVGEAAIGLLVSAWAVTVACASIPLVRLTLRLRRRTVITGALVVTAAGNLVTALAPTFALAVGGRVIAATAHGLFWAVVVAYVATVVDDRRLGRALALVLAGPVLAGLAGLPLASALAVAAGWRPVFVVTTTVLLVLAAATALVLPRHEAAEPGRAAGRWDGSAREVVAVSAGGALVLVGHFAVFTFVAGVVTAHGGVGSDRVPAVLLVLGASGAVGLALSAPATDRAPGLAAPASAGVLALGLAVLVLAEGRPALFVVGLVVWGVAVGAFPPCLQAHVMRSSSDAFRPVAGSVVVTALNLGVAGGAAGGGVVVALSPDALVPAALGVAGLGVAALAWVGSPARRPRAATGSVGGRA